MIKTIQANSLEKLDEEVNAFMKARKQNLPVRTESYDIGGSIWHKATIFFDERFQTEQPDAIEEEVIRMDDEKVYADRNDVFQKKSEQSPDKLGALWWQENGSLTGKFKGENIAMTASVIEKLKANGKTEVKMRGVDVFVMANKFKNKPTAPDYVIMNIEPNTLQ